MVKITRKELIEEYFEFKRKDFSKQQEDFYKYNSDRLKVFYEKYKYEIEKYIEEYRIKYKKEIYQEKLLNQRKKYAKDKKGMSLYSQCRRIRILKAWEGIIPKETDCQACNKRIYFNKGNQRDAIHFDHKKETVRIKGSPSTWLLSHKPTPENIKIWNSCNFGMLCNRCNRYIPTKDRKNFLKKIIKYVFHE